MTSPGNIFAIGDIHGCADELKELVERLPLAPDSTLVFLGDYIDRGPKAREVVDYVLELRRSHNVVCLRGNHEELFEQFREDPGSAGAGLFIYSGGSATLASYGNRDGDFNFPKEHLEFFEGLQVSYHTDHYFFVHAGVPEIPLEKIDHRIHSSIMMWTRDRFLDSRFLWSKVIVHGHSPVSEVELTPSRINLDTGCVYGGRLSALSINDLQVYSVRRKAVAERVVLRDQRSRRRAVRFKGEVKVSVRRGEASVAFQTSDYSELGMFMRDLENGTRLIFKSGDVIEGEVGHDASNLIRFRGKIVRAMVQGGAAWYGVEILSS